MVLDVCVRMILRRIERGLTNFATLGGVLFYFFLIWGKVLSHLISGSVSMYVMSGVLCPSTTLRVDVSASSLYVTPAYDLTLPMRVLYPMLSRV